MPSRLAQPIITSQRFCSDVSVDAVPQQFDGALVAIGRQHAGAAEFEELQLVVARDQAADVEFAGGVEAAMIFGELLAQQAIGADDGRAIAGLAVARIVIENQQ